MAFTFNWAGVQGVNPIAVADRTNLVRDDAANFGKAAIGYKRHEANQEYADILGQYDPIDNSAEIQELVAELARLEQRNEAIRAQIGG